VREDRRLVTAMFVDLRGSTTLAERVDVEDMRELLSWFTTAVIDVAEGLGGSINDLAGDGVLALFGAPMAREDDPARAVRAGLGVQQAMVEVGRNAFERFGFRDIAARVGIETGHVAAGAVGGGSRVEYGVTGDAVNVAARLQSLCEVGGVLVGPETVHQVRAQFRWGAPAVLQLKGRSAPVQARQALAFIGLRDGGGGRHRRPGLAKDESVGRSSERATVEEMVRTLDHGAGRVVVVEGGPGLGKTALARHAERWAKTAGVAVWRLPCASDQQAIPFAALGALPGLDAEPIPENGIALAQRHDVLETVRSLAANATAERGLLVVVEDIHWADPSSLDALIVLAEASRRTPLLLFMTARDQGSGVGLPAAVRVDTVVTLKPLAQNDARRLLNMLLGPISLPPDVVRRLVGVARGNPLFIEHMVRGLIDGGLHEGASADQTRALVQQVGIPATFERLIQSRLDQLGPDAAATLCALSVLRVPFDEALAVELLGTATDSDAPRYHNQASAHPDATDTLAILVDRGWLARAGTSYEFSHAAARDAIERTLLRDDRRQLNLKAAKALTQRLGDGGVGVVAAHWERGGDSSLALGCHLRAADQAELVSALPEALTHVDAALALAHTRSDDAGLAELFNRRAGLRSRTGDPHGGLADAEHALTLANQLIRDDLRQGALEQMAAALEGAVDYGAAAHVQGEALRLAEQRTDVSGQVRGHSRLAIHRVNQLRFAEADEHCRSALALVAGQIETRDKPLEAAALDAAKQISLQLGEPHEVQRLCSALTALHRRNRDVWQEQFVQLELGIIAGEQARWDAARMHIRAGLSMNRQVDDVANEPLFVAQRGAVARAQGRYVEALDLAGQAVDSARRHGHSEWQAWALGTAANIHVDVGDWTGAATAARASIAHARTAGASLHLLRGQAALAMALARSGEGGDAADALAACASQLHRVSLPPGRTFLWGWKAYAAVGLLTGLTSDPRQGLLTIDPVLLAARSAHFAEATVTLLLARARLLLALDQTDTAVEAAVEAAGLASRRRLAGLAWKAQAAVAALSAGESQARAYQVARASSDSLLETLPNGTMSADFMLLRDRVIGEQGWP